MEKLKTVTAGQEDFMRSGRPVVPIRASLSVPVDEEFARRVSVLTYDDGFHEIYVDDVEIGTPQVAVAVAEALLTAARHNSNATYLTGRV